MVSIELMNTFTDEQLIMCEKETLITYIRDLKKDIDDKDFELATRPPRDESVASDSMISLLFTEFLTEHCEPKNMNVKNFRQFAPTSFNNIYDSFREYITIVDGGRLGPESKLKVKALLIDWQKNSIYSYVVGKVKADKKPNGSNKFPMFNLKVLVDEDGDLIFKD